MLFRDRIQAGERLAESMQEFYKSLETIVLGLPRGGVVTAAAIAKKLQLPLDILSVRKVGAPTNPELALGAVCYTGDVFLNNHLIALLHVPHKYLKAQINAEKIIAQERFKRFRKGKPPLNVKDKTIILVDDGLATGATMQAAILALRSMDVLKIVVAVPVASPDTLEEIEKKADQSICLFVPSFFQAVGEFYEKFNQVEDEEVTELLT